jgi:hypothetical protein
VEGFAATATAKVIAETRQFGSTDLTVVEFADLFTVVRGFPCFAVAFEFF